MIVETVTLKLYAPWVHSLKEKRMLVKSIIDRVRHKFNVAIAEVAEQDTHQTVILGLACVAGSVNLADAVMDKVIQFIENNTEAEILKVTREIR